ncbi:MAG TPA: glycine cleavage system aminomethyltransferase GcvT [Aestuariivirgaceae bacterium]|nr:glycine cleavage system aminomethyltransferase GcvT [Aestuariivirgaceae bacterium]
MTAKPVAPGTLRQTPLAAAHRRRGARMVPFAGYEMPLQYQGIVAEHLWTRTNAGLFDVSHMGQIFLEGGNHTAVAAALERLVPADIAGLAPGRIRYTQLIAASGGIIDDLMVTRPQREDGRLILVVNASRKAIDEAWLRENLPPAIAVDPQNELALLALQGPGAAEVMGRLSQPAQELAFMTAMDANLSGLAARVSRSGYTGEDGFEISLEADDAEALFDLVLGDERVRPIGLGARDSLRLEAGLCLYGQDIDESTSPIEAGLSWSIPARRRQDCDFIGANRIAQELARGVARRRVGLTPQGRVPVRHGSAIRDGKEAEIGTVTSGGFSPSLGVPIAMGYVASALADAGTVVAVSVRDKGIPSVITRLPFVPHRYKR